MTAGPSRSPPPATAPTRYGCAAGSSTPTQQPARSAPSTTPSGSRTPPCSRPVATGERRSAPPARPRTRPTSSTSWPPASAAVRACPRPWLSIRGCSSPSRRRPWARSIAARRKGGGCIPATPTGKDRPARMAGGRAAGSATTRTTPGWASHCAPAATRPTPRVLWNALAGRLWSRTTIYLYRVLAQLAGLTEEELRRLVRVSFAKVAEYQKRGAVHFHAIIRLDAATDCGCPACVAPPPSGFTADLLERAVRRAAASVAVSCPALHEDQGVTLMARWGEQLDVLHITEAGDEQ